MVTEVYELEVQKTGDKRRFEIIYPYYNKATIVDGVRFVEIFFEKMFSTALGELIS